MGPTLPTASFGVGVVGEEVGRGKIWGREKLIFGREIPVVKGCFLMREYD